MTRKQTVAAKAMALGATFDKVKTKIVGFEDLARGSAIFISFDRFKWADNGASIADRYEALRATAKENGYILSL